MRLRALTVFFLIVFVVMATAGCGGGGQSADEPQGDGGAETRKEKTRKNVTVPELTFVSGTLGRVDTEKGRLTLRPDEGEGPLRFKFNPEGVKVTVDGEEVQPQILAGRQQAEVGYFMRNDRMVARVIRAQSGGGEPGG